MVQDDKGTWPIFDIMEEAGLKLSREVAQMELEDVEIDAILRRDFIDMRFIYKRNPDGSFLRPYEGAILQDRLKSIQRIWHLEEKDLGEHFNRVWHALQAAAFVVRQDLVKMARYAQGLEGEIRRIQSHRAASV